VEPCRRLGAYPERLTDRLDHWALHAPGRTFLAERDLHGRWRRISYSAFRRQSCAAARWLLAAGLSAERPLAILSGNDIEHAILAVGAMYAGIPYAPVSPAYSLISSDFCRLRHVFELLTPGMIFAADGDAYGRAIEAAAPPDAMLVVARNSPHPRTLRFADAISASADGPLPRVGPDHIAKILFTSGSTNVPKGVITTHRMLASNQEMLRTVFPFFAREPLAVCDWLPWNHTFGGSHNFGLVLYNGGSMYLDAGRPVEGLFEQSVANLREIAPTVYFNVPKGYEMLVRHLRCDAALRTRFFSRLRMMFYAGAGLSPYLWDELEQFARETRGHSVPILTGLGATETAPFAMCASPSTAGAGVVGLPVPGVRLKLVPVAGKLEARFRGPNVTPGYWRQPDLTAAAFDDDGYYRMGDGVRAIDPADPGRGFLFDGRLSEDFKLSTGTWVSVGPLRAGFLRHCAPLVHDVVIAGHDRDEVTALIFLDPRQNSCLSEPAHIALERLLGTFAASNPGSSMRIARALVMEEPPSLDAGELTDKGSVNQAAVLARRFADVKRLYATPCSADVICAAPLRAARAGVTE
jgi:feruloyl-CoA synthase